MDHRLLVSGAASQVGGHEYTIQMVTLVTILLSRMLSKDVIFLSDAVATGVGDEENAVQMITVG